MAMNPELKAKWVAALRSGKYEQARCQLSDGVGFCCLGVLCELMKRPYTPEFSFPSTDIQAEAGLNASNCKVLANLNDGAGGSIRHSFPEIADYIEKNL